MKTFQVSYNPSSIRYSEKDHWSDFENSVITFKKRGFAMYWTIRNSVKVGTLKLGDRVLVYKTGQQRNGLIGVSSIFKIEQRLGYVKRIHIVFSGFQAKPIPIDIDYHSFAASITKARLNPEVNRAIEKLLK